MIRVKNYGDTRRDFEVCLRRFKNKTNDRMKEFVLRQSFEKPCVEKERIRRRFKKKKRKLQGIKRKYGYKWVLYRDLLR